MSSQVSLYDKGGDVTLDEGLNFHDAIGAVIRKVIGSKSLKIIGLG